MNADRTCAPARPTTLAERSPASGRTQSAPVDAFSALLGAVAAPAEAARPAHQRSDDAPRHDDTPGHEAEDAPAAIAPAGEPATPPADAPVEPAARLVTPEIFALQLASPLPPAVAPSPVAAPVATEPAAASVLPAFAPAAPTPQTVVPAPTEAVAASVEPLAAPVPAPTAAPAPVPPLLTGLTPASALPADAVAVTEPAAAPPPQAPVIAAPADAPAVQSETAGAAPSTPSPFSQGGSDPQPQQQPAAPAAVAPQVEPADAPASAPAATSPIAAPAAAATQMAQAPTGIERAVPLYRAVETTATLLHVAAERGVTHARLNLKPVELGGIEVRLQSTPQGVSAQLVADSPEAARMLAQASDDLRRQLSERDVTLLSLDVSTSSDQRHEAAAGGFGGDGFGEGFRPGGGFDGRTGAEPAAEAPTTAETSLVLPGGVLVDVLA